MAVHKVPQDVEAEDKFLGPLSFKQFLFFGGALISLFLIYQVIIIGLPFLIIAILPFLIVCVTLAFPWTKDQPTELWLASRIRFMLVQRKRIWDQDDVKELVTITVPKREAHIYSDGLSQAQVKSRLNALASVIDSKGWAVKDTTPGDAPAPTDRLVTNTSTIVNPMAQHDEPDPFDDNSSTIAQQFDTMIQKSEEKRRQSTRDMVEQALHSQGPTVSPTQAAPANNPWFLQQSPTNDAGMSKFKPGFEDSLNEQKFLDKVHKKQEDDAKQGQNGRMKVVQPISAQPDPTAQQQPPPVQDDQQSTAQQSANAPSPNPIDPAIMTLAQNDDLNVETIARQANREIHLEGDGEVVISLHDEDQVE